jgi:hypothetical protein
MSRTERDLMPLRLRVVFLGSSHEAPTANGRGLSAEQVAQLPLLIIPAPTVTPVASSMRMNEPVVRFFE